MFTSSSWYNIPHPSLMISSIRINDVWLLLGIGIIYEGLCRFYLLWNCKLKSNTLLRKEVEYQQLQQQITQQKKLGPSSFVTTSKLERQSLQYDKELQIIYEQRKKTTDQVEKQLLRYGNIQITILIFILYYGIPIITFTTSSNDDDNDADTTAAVAGNYIKRLLFPISYIGMGMRISRYGIVPSIIANTSFGALSIYWSGQVMMGQFMDMMDAYYLS